MCVQYVTKPSLTPEILKHIERFIEENSKTGLPPWVILQRPRIRNVEIFEIGCNSYIHVIKLTKFFFKSKLNTSNTSHRL